MHLMLVKDISERIVGGAIEYKRRLLGKEVQGKLAGNTRGKMTMRGMTEE